MTDASSASEERQKVKAEKDLARGDTMGEGTDSRTAMEEPSGSNVAPLDIPPDRYVTRDVTVAKGVVRVIKDHWWWCVNGDAKKAVFYVARRPRDIGSPQCNTSRWLAERIMPSLPGALLVKIETAFVPHRDEP